MEMFGSQTALLASRLGSELPRRGVEVAQRKPCHFHESTKSSLMMKQFETNCWMKSL